MTSVYTYTQAEQFPDPACLIAASVDPMHNGHVPVHAHEFSEIVCVVAGVGEYRLGDQRLPAAAGDVFVITPGEVHDVTAASQMQLNNIMCDRAVLDVAFTGVSAYAALFDLLPRVRGGPAGRRHLRLSPDELAAVRDRHAVLVSECTTRGSLWRQRVSALLHEVVALMCRSWSRQHPVAEAAPLARMARLVGYIHAHLDQSLSLDDLAQVANCSPTHVRRLFHDHFAQAPKAYVLARRLDRAAELLQSSDQPITSIGLSCGFCDGNHFAKAFRRARGVSPGAFRLQSGVGSNGAVT